MKKKIIYGLLFAVAMVTASSSFVSCKDYEGDNYAELREQNASLRAYLDAQIAAIKQCDCSGKWTTLYQTDLPQYLKTTDLVQQIGSNSSSIVNVLSGALASGGYATQQDIATYFNTHKPDMTGYATTADLDALRNYIMLGDSLKNAYAWASYSYQRLKAQGDSLKIAYEQAQTNKDSIKILADSIDQVALDAQKNFETAKALADSAIALAQNALDSIGKVDAKVADLDSAMKAADADLQAQIDTLKDRVKGVEDRLDVLEPKVENILGTLKKQITGVIIQGTYSPVLGNGSLPLGIQTNLLAAYASKSTANVDFPSIYDEDYADGSTVLTAADQAYLQSLGFWPAEVSLEKGQYVISDRDDNAGKLYLTVNPTNIDFEGTNFDLVNSKGQVSRMQLSNLKACDEVLNFGWTRAGVQSTSSNGFYVADAKVAEEDITKLQAAINTDKFQKAFKEELNSAKNGTSYVSYSAAMDLARAVYGSLEPLQRFGVRAEWQDAAAGVSRSYTSAFDIAATVVNPLGFGFTIPDTKFTRLPVFDTNYLRNKFHINATINPIVRPVNADGRTIITVTIKDWQINMPDISENISVTGASGTATGTLTIDGEKYAIVINNKDMQIDVTDMYVDIFGQINTSMATFKDVLAAANKRIDYVVNYIDRYNTYAVKANKYIRNANNLLQPVLLWCDGQNVGQLGGLVSANYAVGTIVPAGGSVALIPTSYTLELLAPAYKKSVVCTNVYKDGLTAQGGESDLVAAAKAVNENLKNDGFNLFEGNDLNGFIFEADSKYEGMTFEFAYTALDYTGQVAGRKFYLTVGAAK